MITRKKYYLQSALLIAIMSSMGAAYGATNQPAPDAGTVLKDIERNQEKKQLDLPKTDEGIKGKKEKTGTKVKIKSFEFKGNDSVTTEELEKVVAKYIGQELTVDDLQELPVILNAYYREKGWLSDITLPNQDVTNGIVRFNVVEAKFGGADLALQPQDSGYYVNPSIVKGIVDSHMGSDKKLNLKALDRALLIANDLPGVSVKGVLQAGKKSGETDVAVSIKNKPRFTSVVSTDNYGARSTGRARLLGDFTYASPLRLGDKLNLSLLKTEGVEYGRLSYNVPFGNNGLTVGVNGSFLQYEVVSRDLGKSSHVRGFSKSAGLEARYPVIRTQSTNLYANTNYDFKHFKNKSDVLESQSEYNVNTFTIGLTGDHFDQFILNGASNNASLQLTSGNNQKKYFGWITWQV